MEQQHESLIDDAINVIAELGIEALNIAENKLHFKRQELKAQDSAPCPQGFHKNDKGECVPDVG